MKKKLKKGPKIVIFRENWKKTKKTQKTSFFSKTPFFVKNRKKRQKNANFWKKMKKKKNFFF